MNTTPKERFEVCQCLGSLGLSYEQVAQLRRIAMTLQRWYELECGVEGAGNSTHSIERDDNGDGKPFYRVQYQSATAGWIDNRRPIADREKGALKRLAGLMSTMPELTYYVQTDPRGASLFILKRKDVGGAQIEQVYNRGVAVY